LYEFEGYSSSPDAIKEDPRGLRLKIFCGGNFGARAEPIASMLVAPADAIVIFKAWSTWAYDTPSALGSSESGGPSPFIPQAAK
jgi:hypothetical protein